MIWLISILMIVCGVIGVVYMKYQSDLLKEEYQTVIDCPDRVTKIDAYYDQYKDKGDRLGLMHCYCLDRLKKNPTKVLQTKFKDIDPSDKTEYCNDWFINYASQQAMVYGTSVVVVAINVIICFSFELISKLERHHTQNDETMGMF